MADLKFVEKRHKFEHNGKAPLPTLFSLRPALHACGTWPGRVKLTEQARIAGQTVYEWSQAIDEVNIYMYVRLWTCL